MRVPHWLILFPIRNRKIMLNLYRESVVKNATRRSIIDNLYIENFPSGRLV